jgi:hypothetical protein
MVRRLVGSAAGGSAACSAGGMLGTKLLGLAEAADLYILYIYIYVIYIHTHTHIFIYKYLHVCKYV